VRYTELSAARFKDFWRDWRTSLPSPREVQRAAHRSDMRGTQVEPRASPQGSRPGHRPGLLGRRR